MNARHRLGLQTRALATPPLAGLPRSLVDIRHQATHNELPSLPTLRLGAADALEWLRASYWERQEAQLRGAADRVAGILREFLALHGAAAAKAAAAGVAAAGASSGDEDNDSHPGGSGASPEAYRAVAAKKRRRALLVELKTVVPGGSTSLLAAALLTPTSAAEGGDAAAAPALSAALTHLSAEWPPLPGVLLLAAVERLASASEGGGDSSEIVTAWLDVLLPKAGLSPGQVLRLLGVCLPAYAKARQMRALQEPSTSIHGTDDSTSPLQRVVRHLLHLSGADDVNRPCGSEGQEPAERPVKRWRRVGTWARCAIGAVPCAFNPSGQPPPLDLPLEETAKKEVEPEGGVTGPSLAFPPEPVYDPTLATALLPSRLQPDFHAEAEWPAKDGLMQRLVLGAAAEPPASTLQLDANPRETAGGPPSLADALELLV
jgi:hypothetical protein